MRSGSLDAPAPLQGSLLAHGWEAAREGIVVACPATGRRASQSAFAAAASASAWCSPYSLYGESGDVTRALYRLKLPSAVAIRSNHLVWMFSGERMRHTRWRLYDCVFADGSSERRCCARSSSAGGCPTRYSQLTIDPVRQPEETIWSLKTNLSGNIGAVSTTRLVCARKTRIQLQSGQR